MFVTRLISGIIMLILAYLTINRGGLLLIGMLFTLSIIGLGELYKIEKIQFSLTAVVSYVLTAFYYVVLYFFGFSVHLISIIVLLFLLLAVLFVLQFPKLELSQVMLTFFGFFYLSFLLSFLYITRMTEYGSLSVWLIFIGAWGADTCAYCIGMLFGKRKLAPVLSPKKSVEGAIGGTVGSALLGLLFAFVFYKKGFLQTETLYIYPVTCFMAAVLSIFGDLFASAIKRKYDLKDYGHIIPGHGGVLDRFDSILFVAPMIYFVTELLYFIFKRMKI